MAKIFYEKYPLKEKDNFYEIDTEEKHIISFLKIQEKLCYDEVINIWKLHLLRTTGISEKQALRIVEENINTVPAWMENYGINT